VRIAVRHEHKTQVYRLEGKQLAREGDAVDGEGLALVGTRLVVATEGGSKKGPWGAFQLHVRELQKGKWTATTALLDVDDVSHPAFAWQKDRIIVVAPEDKETRGAVTARVIVGTGGKWKDVGVAKLNVTSPSR
jgi:hypothetical protein